VAAAVAASNSIRNGMFRFNGVTIPHPWRVDLTEFLNLIAGNRFEGRR